MIILSERGAPPACRKGRWIVKFLFPCLSPLSPKKWDATKLSSLLAISDTRLHNTRTQLPLSLSLCITEYSIVFVRLLIESFSVYLLTVGGFEPVIRRRGELVVNIYCWREENVATPSIHSESLYLILHTPLTLGHCSSPDPSI